MKAVNIATGIALFLALGQLPIDYYTFLRILVFIAAGLNIYLIVKDRGITTWAVFFGVTAILFNPILPIHLNSKAAWAIIDIVVGSGFFLKVGASNYKSIISFSFLSLMYFVGFWIAHDQIYNYRVFLDDFLRNMDFSLSKLFSYQYPIPDTYLFVVPIFLLFFIRAVYFVIRERNESETPLT